MNKEKKQQLLKKLISMSEDNVYRGELEKRFANRMLVTGKNEKRYNAQLKQASFLQEEEKERLKMYQDVLNEIK